MRAEIPASKEQPFPPTDVAGLQQLFRPTIERYRKQRKIASLIGFCAIFVVFGSITLLILCATLLPKHGSIAVFAGFIMVIAVVSAIFSQTVIPRLICPACAKTLDKDLGHYCPECGSNKIQAPEALEWSQLRNLSKTELVEKMKLTQPHCKTCGGSFELPRGGGRTRRGAIRRYKVRFCTHCGLQLDQEGF